MTTLTEVKPSAYTAGVRPAPPSRTPRECSRCHEIRPCPHAGRVCHACYESAQRGGVRMTAGPCVEPGCPWTGRSRSGYCPRHYHRLQHRSKNFRRLVGTALHLAAVRLALERTRPDDVMEAEAVRLAARVFTALERGEAVLARNPMFGKPFNRRRA